MKSTFLVSLIPFVQGVLDSAEVVVIISNDRVVTSAQCVYGLEASPTILSVRAGSSKTSSGGSAWTVSKIDRNTRFNTDTNDFDVAVLELFSPLVPGPTVKPIEFIQSGQEPEDGTECVASGWGDSGGQLQSVTLPIVNREECNRTYAGQVTDRMICAGSETGKGTCPGDRGGPVTCGGTFAGIISQTNGCELLGRPDVFTDVANSYIQSWIQDQ
ncbi:uncharacterized protein N7518_002957 [Penicillium psychrosexuale]|uniref:uncharacterized protein n=1 Tax=Penicillium psychrosexuale TaxID=1002107 RepID=UPI0025451A7F|nr:uncharacterized protein N7518_002957 [Penicillium psychrosexuale]KAJ5800889.1 hypothetical protein N7518_002957 [Penicillium psychrosexuale]